MSKKNDDEQESLIVSTSTTTEKEDEVKKNSEDEKSIKIGAEAIKKAEEIVSESQRVYYTEFLRVVKELPDRFCSKLDRKEIPSYLEIIGSKYYLYIYIYHGT